MTLESLKPPWKSMTKPEKLTLVQTLRQKEPTQ